MNASQDLVHHTAAAAPAAAGPAPRPLLAALAALAGARVAFWLLAPPNPDEAYYWLWGLHPGLGYYDHAPLHAWTQGLVHAALGRSRFALRLAPALTTAGSLWVLWLFAARLEPGAPRPRAAAAAAAFLASPLFLMFTAFAWPDHLLVFLALLAGWLWLGFAEEVAAGGRGSGARLLGAALALGLAGLAKYNALFLGLGFALALALDRRTRSALRDGRLWAAALLALAISAPVLVWNAGHGAASFRYNLLERHLDGGALRVNLRGTLNLLLYALLSLSPFLAWGLASALRRPAPGAPEPAASLHRRLAVTCLLVTAASLLALSTFSLVLYYWLLPGLVLLAPLGAALLDRPRLLRAHLAFGLVAAGAMAFHAAVVPISALWPRIQDEDSKATWGWDEVGLAVRRERVAAPAGLVAATDYRTAAMLAFALDDRDVTALSPRRSQFDFWLDREALRGASALLVADRWHPMTPFVARQFASVRKVATVPVTRLGVFVKDYELWRGEGFGLSAGQEIPATRQPAR